MRSPGSSSDWSPRNLFTTNPRSSRWSSSGMSFNVPYIAAKTPPRSMSPTTTVGTFPCCASPMLTKSCSRRLISVGLPAPSQTTTSYLLARSSKAA